MNIKALSCIYFSPTGTTKAIVECIVQGMKNIENSVEQVRMLDITKPSGRENFPIKFKNEIVILAAPVYYGRIPELIASCFSKLRAEQTPVVLVAVYGNRAFDDALKELHDIALTRGFIPLAASAFIGEHSYSSSDYPIAQARPDDSDMQKARNFGVAVREKFENLNSLENFSPPAIPGNPAPYIEPKNLNMIKQARSAVALTPETDKEKCSLCGQCAEVCPGGAISPDDPTQTDRWKCIICFACVKLCPENARQMNEPNFQTAIQGLYKMCQERKEPEFYL